MDATYQSPTLSNDENVINILVFQQDNNASMLQQDLVISDGTQLTDNQRAISSTASPATSVTTRGLLSSSQSHNEILSYSMFKRAPQANSTPRPSLNKSQSFTVGQCEVGLQYPDLDDLRTISGFSNNSLKWDGKILSNSMETNTEGIGFSQLSVKTDRKLLGHCGNKILRHRSVSIPVGHSGVRSMSPDRFVKTLRPSSINSLTATPDSGFWSPGSSVIEESLSTASPSFSTPKRFRFGGKAEHDDVESPVYKVLVEEATNVDHGDESALDKSLNCVNWLETFAVGHTMKPLIVSTSNQARKPVATPFCSDQAQVLKSEPLPRATPVININSVASGSQQTRSTQLPQLRMALMIPSKQAISTPLQQLRMTPMVSSTQAVSVPQLRMAPTVSSKQAVSTSLPPLSMVSSTQAISAPLPKLSMAPMVSSKQAISAPQLSMAPMISSQQAISSALPQLRMTPMISSKQAVSASLPQLRTAATVPSKQAMSVPLPQLNVAPVSTQPYSLPERKVLQELNSNICYNPVPTAQAPKPQHERPSYAYMDLIKMALKDSEEGQLTLKEILAWIEDHFPYFRYTAKQSWKSSVRCNLSLHQDFTKVEAGKRGGKWKVAENARSYMHRLHKPPVIKQPTGSKVAAVTRLKSSRSGPLPILPKSVPYALVPLSLATLEPSNQTQNIHDQAVQILHHHHRPAVLQPVQVQQILHNQQQQTHLLTCQHLPAPASSTNSHKPKTSLQQIAPKLNLNPPTLVWDSKSFVKLSYKDNGQVSKSRVEVQSVSNGSSVTQIPGGVTQIPGGVTQIPGGVTQIPEGVTQIPGGVNTSSVNVTMDRGKLGLVFRPSISDRLLESMDIQIQPGSLANEKKIVFILKQRHQPEKQVNQVPASMLAENNHCLVRDNDLLKNTVNTRSVCKTVDGMQRSKSDVGYRRTSVGPYCIRKSEDGSTKAPIVNLEHLLKGGKQDEGAAEIFMMNDDDDCEGDLAVELPSGFCHSSKKSAPRPESAPAKCLIQQAWDQASTLSEDDPSDGYLLGSHSSGGHEKRNHHVPATNIRQTAVSSHAFPNKNEVSAASGNQQNVYYVVCNDFPTLPKGLDHPTIQRTTSYQSNINALQHVTQEYRAVNSRSESIKDKEVASQCRMISMNNENMPTFQIGKGGTFITGAGECHTKENQTPTPVRADKAVLARKIIFHSTPNSHRSMRSSNEDSRCKQETISPVVTNCPPQPTINRMKSRRKQIHTPMSTNSSPDRETPCFDSTTDVRNDYLKPGSGVGLTQTCVSGGNIHLCRTPPGGPQHPSRTTSSPFSDNPSPLDFAAFLSTLSTSPQLNLYVDNTVPSVKQTKEFIHNQSSTTPPSNSSIRTSLPPSVSMTPSRIPVSFLPSSGVVENRAVAESPETNLSSSSIHSTPGVTTSRSHFLNNDLSFLSSTAPSLPNADLNDSLPLMPSVQFDHFLYLKTPPVGSQRAPAASTPSYGMQLAQENHPGPANSSGLLDSSLFDTLDSFMHNLEEFKTP